MVLFIMAPFSSTPKSTEKKCVRLCPDCNRAVDRDGYSIDPYHCDECPNHSPNEPECATCGFFLCDQSC